MTETSVDAICRRIDDEGYCIVPDVISSEDLERVRAALDRALAEDEAAGRAQRYGPNGTNQRVWALLNRGEEFISLAAHPLALAVVRKSIGYHEVLLSTLTANITNPGGDREIGRLHTDQGYLPEGFPYRVAANVAFFLDDYTVENGATLIVPKSHKLRNFPDSSKLAPSTPAQLTGRAGGMAVWDGRLHHATGLNRTADQRRRGVLATYIAPFIRGQENWCRTLDPRLLDLHPELALLTGFEEWQTLGGTNGAKSGLNF